MDRRSCCTWVQLLMVSYKYTVKEQQCLPPTARIAEVYLPKCFWNTAGTPSHLAEGAPESVPRQVSVMLSPYMTRFAPCTVCQCIACQLGKNMRTAAAFTHNTTRRSRMHLNSVISSNFLGKLSGKAELRFRSFHWFQLRSHARSAPLVQA